MCVCVREREGGTYSLRKQWPENDVSITVVLLIWALAKKIAKITICWKGPMFLTMTREWCFDNCGFVNMGMHEKDCADYHKLEEAHVFNILVWSTKHILAFIKKRVWIAKSSAKSTSPIIVRASLCILLYCLSLPLLHILLSLLHSTALIWQASMAHCMDGRLIIFIIHSRDSPPN